MFVRASRSDRHGVLRIQQSRPSQTRCRIHLCTAARPMRRRRSAGVVRGPKSARCTGTTWDHHPQENRQRSRSQSLETFDPGIVPNSNRTNPNRPRLHHQAKKKRDPQLDRGSKIGAEISVQGDKKYLTIVAEIVPTSLSKPKRETSSATLKLSRCFRTTREKTLQRFHHSVLLFFA